MKEYVWATSAEFIEGRLRAALGERIDSRLVTAMGGPALMDLYWEFPQRSEPEQIIAKIVGDIRKDEIINFTSVVIDKSIDCYDVALRGFISTISRGFVSTVAL